MGERRTRVMAAMSGGVDSSVAAGLLVQQGYEVIGVTMQLWPSNLPKESEGGCCSLTAVEDARRVADKLGISYYVLNFQDVFQRQVIDQFATEYLDGRTPNPCIRCNEKIKFGALMVKALELGVDYVATGHYAHVGFDADRRRYVVRRAADERKDQTYTMYGLKQEQLARMLFPLWGIDKTETRRLAAEWGLDLVAKKPDSQDICFVPHNDYHEFMESYAPGSVKPGLIVDTSGNELGEHKGIAFYTVGQRKGLGLSGGAPRYVVAIDSKNNAVIVGSKDEVNGSSVDASSVNLQAIAELSDPMRVTAKVRYGRREVPATIEPAGDGVVRTRFDEPEPALTPGQSIVWYDGDVVLGGGIIQPQAVPGPDAALLQMAPVH